MSIVTISAIKATSADTSVTRRCIRSAVGGERRVGEAVAQGLLIDAGVNSCGDDVNR